jgi:hypothetical protein
MKNAIQAKLALELAGMTAKEASAEAWRRAEQDPVLGQWLRRWCVAHGVPARSDADALATVV